MALSPYSRGSLAILALLLAACVWSAGTASPALARGGAAGTGGFSDVSAAEDCCRAVGVLADRGVVSGFVDGTFRPEQPVSRQQFAAVICRALAFPVSETDVSWFVDLPPAGPASLYPDNYVAAIASRGIMLGVGDDSFAPEQAVARAQAVVAVVRALDLVAPGLLVPEPASFASMWGDQIEGEPRRAVRLADWNGLGRHLGGALGPYDPLTRGEAACLVADLLTLLECHADVPVVPEDAIAGVVRDGERRPVVGATVRAQATAVATQTDGAGRFTLTGLRPGEPVRVTAWAGECYITGGEQVVPGTGGLRLTLAVHGTTDDPEYAWLSAFAASGLPGACEQCHSTSAGIPPDDPAVPGGIVDPLPFDQWLLDAHAGSARNPRFLTMYEGTDVTGNRSPPTRYVYVQDYGLRPLPPDPGRPYYGPGHRLDFPESAGNCATCHVPAAAVAEPYGTDPALVTGVATEGATCDFCHKIWDVVLDPVTGLPRPNMPGVLSFEFRRPAPGHQFFAGPFDDVAPGQDTYSPLQRESAYCAPCHFGVFWDTVVYDSFGEWLRSPYSDPATGKTCQDCHMPVPGGAYFARADVGGRQRDPASLHGHRMPGAADEQLLRNALTMTVDAARTDAGVEVEVELYNDKTGHHVPTDSPLRQLVLLVRATTGGAPGASAVPAAVSDEAAADTTATLLQLSGPVLPVWAGVGDPATGHYAGLPGQAYAKVLMETWTEVWPTGAYWNPTRLVSDNRLPAYGRDVTRYGFAAPADRPVEVRVTLLYRRAYKQLMEWKGWDVPDIVMAERTLAVPAAEGGVR